MTNAPRLHTSLILKVGSHDLPSEGTCLVEAAIFAAGFKYRSVSGICNLPDCFCPVISSYAIALNDILDDVPRQRLIPFIPRLMDSRPTTALIALKRAEIFVRAAAKYAAPRALRVIGLHARADALERGSTMTEIGVALADANRALRYSPPRRFGQDHDVDVALHYLTNAILILKKGFGEPTPDLTFFAAVRVAEPVLRTATATANLRAFSPFDWGPFIEAMDDALKIGERPTPVSPVLAEKLAELVAMQDA